eukprot:g8978.t1
MVRTIPAVLLGAGGATAAVEYGNDISGYFKEVMRAVTHHSTRPGNHADGQSSLAGEIDSLKRIMMESNRGQVVVVDKGQSSGWGLWPYGLGLVGLGLIYARFVKGWKLTDFMIVTQASLKASTAALKQGVDGLKDYTAKTKEYLTGRLNVLEDDQKHHMEKTERIDDRLINLGDTVDEMHVELSEVNDHVQQVRGTLNEIQDAQKYNSNGIFLLLRVVRELVYHNDFKIQSRSELEQFSRAAPPLESGETAPGLEGLLAFSSPNDYTDPNRFAESSSTLAVDYHPQMEEIESGPVLNRSVSQREAGSRTEPRVWTRDTKSTSTMEKLGLASLKRRS